MQQVYIGWTPTTLFRDPRLDPMLNLERGESSFGRLGFIFLVLGVFSWRIKPKGLLCNKDLNHRILVAIFKNYGVFYIFLSIIRRVDHTATLIEVFKSMCN